MVRKFATLLNIRSVQIKYGNYYFLMCADALLPRRYVETENIAGFMIMAHVAKRQVENILQNKYSNPLSAKCHRIL
jgi:hypothetical protein